MLQDKQQSFTCWVGRLGRSALPLFHWQWVVNTEAVTGLMLVFVGANCTTLKASHTFKRRMCSQYPCVCPQCQCVIFALTAAVCRLVLLSRGCVLGASGSLVGGTGVGQCGEAV